MSKTKLFEEGGSETRLSDLWLERFRKGELPKPELAKGEALLQNNVDFRLRLAAMDASDREILRELPPDLFWRQLQQRHAVAQGQDRRKPSDIAPLQPWGKRLWRPALALMLVAIALTPVLWQAHRSFPVSGIPPVTEGSGDRLKGRQPKLVIFRKTTQGAEPVRPGEMLSAGTVLRVGYQAAGAKYGAILSYDGNGEVTVHFPASNSQSSVLEKSETLLPMAYELDNAPHFERFYFLTAPAPFDLESWIQRLRRDRILPASSPDPSTSTTLSVFEVQKASAR